MRILKAQETNCKPCRSGLARYYKGELVQALADFDKAIVLNPKISDAYNGSGLTLYSGKNQTRQFADFDRAIAIDPNLAEAYGNRALSLLTLRWDAKAEQDLKKCFELNEPLQPLFDPLANEIKKVRQIRHD